MDRWLTTALDYIASWMDHQMRNTRLPDWRNLRPSWTRARRAFGQASLATGAASRRAIASASPHSELHRRRHPETARTGQAKLDDNIGTYVENLHPAIPHARRSAVLSHSAASMPAPTAAILGFKPFRSGAAARSSQPPIIDPGTRLKYSATATASSAGHRRDTGQPYRSWIKREIVDAAGLGTLPDMPLPRATPFARGHSAMLQLGRRVVPGTTPPTPSRRPAASSARRPIPPCSSTSSRPTRPRACCRSPADGKWCAASGAIRTLLSRATTASAP